MNVLSDDPRIDPRLRTYFATWAATPVSNVTGREALLATETTPESLSNYQSMSNILDSMDGEDVAPSVGLETHTRTILSEPDGNHIRLVIDKPRCTDRLACVYYIHGGAMQILSCFNGNFRAWARLMAARGVAVVMVDFRNCVLPSTAPEVAPYPAGLNDCVSGLRWVYAHGVEWGVDPERIVVAGDSGGGNLAIATALRLNRDGDIRKLKGLFAQCPYIAGEWPLPQNPSSIRNNLLLMDTHHNRGRIAYGIEAFNARDPLAWPGFAVEKDVQGLPPVVIRVNECDPLRDEGVNFYRLLLRSGVAAQCCEVLGTTHAAELFPRVVPDLSREGARAIAHFALSG